MLTSSRLSFPAINNFNCLFDSAKGEIPRAKECCQALVDILKYFIYFIVLLIDGMVNKI